MESLVDMIMVPLNHMRELNLNNNENLMISNLIQDNHTSFIKQSDFKHFKEILIN